MRQHDRKAGKIAGIALMTALALAAPAAAGAQCTNPWVYVSHFLDNTVSIIDTGARLGTVVGVRPLSSPPGDNGHPWGLGGTADGRFIFIAQGSSGGAHRVHVLDGSPNAVVATHDLGPSCNVVGVASNKPGDRLYVNCSNGVQKRDGAFNLLQSTSLPGFHLGYGLSADGSSLFLGNIGSGAGFNICDTSLKCTHIPVTCSVTSIATSTSGNQWAYSCNDGRVFSTGTPHSWEVVSPQGLAYSPNGNLLWVADTGAGAVKRLNLGNGGKLTTPIGCNPVAIDTDPQGRVFSVCTNGSLVVLDPQANVVFAGPSGGSGPISPNGIFIPQTSPHLCGFGC